MGKRYLEHKNPPRNKTASAPYNFVPLPEVIVTPNAHGDNVLPSQSRYSNPDKRKTGYFEVRLTTKSPLFIRGPLSSEEESNKVDTESFFYTNNPNTPVLPGSSLRGMLRHIVSIVSYGKLNNVSNRTMYHRSPDSPSYKAKLGGPKIRDVEALPGFIVYDKKKECYVLHPCEMARISLTEFGNKTVYEGMFEKTKNDEHPSWNGTFSQWQRIWVNVPKTGKKGKKGQLLHQVSSISTTPRTGGNWREGILVLTGNTQIKKYPGKRKDNKKGKPKSDVPQFVFFKPNMSLKAVFRLPTDLVNQFHDEQLTKWQEHAFPANKPDRGCRKKDGWLRNDAGATDWGDPVFYLTKKKNPKEIFAFGRSLYFRIPYESTPADLIPPALKNPAIIDFAEALFGYTDKEKSKAYSSYKGRVQVTSASTTDTDCLFSQPIMPSILETPKPTTIQHYLTQSQSSKSHLNTFDSSLEQTEIRGHKLYWHHKGVKNKESAWRNHISSEPNPDTEKTGTSIDRTPITCVKPGTTFRFKVYFENLLLEELGALCWALQPNGYENKCYVHYLGMGKPLGLGSIKLDASLHLIAPNQRYQHLLETDCWQMGTVTNVNFQNVSENPAVSAFEKCVLDQLDPVWEGVAPSASDTGATSDQRSSGATYQAFEGLANLIDSSEEKNKVAEDASLDRPKYLREMKRIALFLKMMEWPGIRPHPNQGLTVRDSNSQKNWQPNIRYMVIGTQNEFKDRPVLPTPGQYGESLPERLAVSKIDPRNNDLT